MVAAVYSTVLAAIYPDVETAFPGVPVAYPNGPIDLNAVPDLWAEVEVVFTTADQVNLAVNPKTRQRGFVYVSVYAREGTGTAAGAGLLAWFTGRLAYLRSGGLQLKEATAVTEPNARGWFVTGLKVEFFYDPP